MGRVNPALPILCKLIKLKIIKRKPTKFQDIRLKKLIRRKRKKNLTLNSAREAL